MNKNNLISLAFYARSDSVWVAPKEGYMTIEEYNRLNAVYNAKTEQQLHAESKYMRENADEIVSKYRREQLKAVRAADLEQEIKKKQVEREDYTSCTDLEEFETAAPALGKWQTVVRRCVIKFYYRNRSRKTLTYTMSIHFQRSEAD